ncbi:hypothetical protein [Gluconobacter oxydans]|uniref:hypothetical protein n=1 Tax=Gluconobacter oxydans TaxID=442 RepID=UPI00078597E3|nr:hypothetical protein [Gluconobacter oxydans]KXV11558.1 hypothetical protein AD932_11055 [Gluconobacter oxydans]
MFVVPDGMGCYAMDLATVVGWIGAIAWAATGDDAKIKTRFRALSTRKKVLLVLELVFIEAAATGYLVFHHSSHATRLLH